MWITASRPEFGVLQPFFKPEEPITIDAVQTCYPGLSPDFTTTAQFVLASVVFHLWHRNLRRLLHAQHPLFKTTLIAHQASMLSKLSGLVERRMWIEGDPINPTGATVSQFIYYLDKFAMLSPMFYLQYKS